MLSRFINYKQGIFIAIVVVVATILGVDTACLQDWTQWSSMCYKLSSDSVEKTWDGAKSICIQDGGNLASINSEEENLFVTSLLVKTMTEEVWIGLNDLDNDSQFTWTDDSAFGYSNWTNPPTNHSNTYCVLTSKQGPWRLSGCSNWFPFLCKYVPLEVQDFSVQAKITRQQLYTSVQNRILLNHLITKLVAPSILHCSALCLKDARCLSFGYKTRNVEIQDGVCRLHSATAKEFPEDFVQRLDNIYALPTK